MLKHALYRAMDEFAHAFGDQALIEAILSWLNANFGDTYELSKKDR